MLTLQNIIQEPGKFKVLIVDDDIQSRRSLKNDLRNIGFTNLRETGGGEKALSKALSEDISFIVCKSLLIQTIRANSKHKQTPLLAIAHNGDREQFDEIRQMGADNCLNAECSLKDLEDKTIEILFDKLPACPIDCHLQKAGALIVKGNIEEAHKELDIAAEIDPKNPMVSYFRGRAMEAEGRSEEAVAVAALAKENFKGQILNPKEAGKKLELGKTQLAKGSIEEARSAFNDAIKLDPENVGLSTDIGESYLSHGLPQEAEKAFKASLEANPDDIYLYNRLGIAYRRQKKLPDAIGNYRKALSVAPYEETLYYNLGRAYLDAGDKNNASLSLKKAVKIYPDFKEAKVLLQKIAKN